MRREYMYGIVVGIGMLLYLWLGAVTVHAQTQPPPNCEDVLSVYNNIVRGWHCVDVPERIACYGNTLVKVEPPSTGFHAAGKRIAFARFDSIETITSGSQRGAALLVADSNNGQVKIYAIGNSNFALGATPSAFTMYRTNGQDVCERTPSGLLVQSEQRRQGQITVNGVTIDLGSTAYVSIEGDLMFDQDPRSGRRKGSRNHSAPLCSGFDSECNFANCPINGRLVWGPYCRGDIYPYIRTGLYRVTLYGRGEVTAGATDFGSTGKMFSITAQNMTLPASYTFCWNGRRANGTGFETIVLARSQDARVDHLALEYLGADCNAVYRLSSATPELMTVTNVEGSVTVSAGGVSRSPRPGQEVRVHFVNGRPRTIDPPVPATALPLSPLIRDLTYEVLPFVNQQDSHPYEPTAPPTADVPYEPAEPSASDIVEIDCGPAQVEIEQGECVEVWWDVEYVRAVYFDGHGVTGHERQTVCPSSSHRYDLRVVTDGGERYCYMDVQVMDSQPPPAPMLLEPADGSGWRYGDPRWNSVELVWRSATDPSGILLYEVDIEIDEHYDSNWRPYRRWSVVASGSDTVSTVLQADQQRPYRWRVRAFDGESNGSNWSSWFHFNTTEYPG